MDSVPSPKKVPCATKIGDKNSTLVMELGQGRLLKALLSHYEFKTKMSPTGQVYFYHCSSGSRITLVILNHLQMEMSDDFKFTNIIPLVIRDSASTTPAPNGANWLIVGGVIVPDFDGANTSEEDKSPRYKCIPAHSTASSAIMAGFVIATGGESGVDIIDLDFSCHELSSVGIGRKDGERLMLTDGDSFKLVPLKVPSEMELSILRSFLRPLCPAVLLSTRRDVNMGEQDKIFLSAIGHMVSTLNDTLIEQAPMILV